MSEASEPPRLKPNFLIIGAQRAGTTSLYSYLLEHPCIASAAKKEVHFFDVHFSNGEAWYWRQFSPRTPNDPPGLITGEASPYYMFHPLAAERAAALLPGAKLIALLRNPIDRALSHYQHEIRRGKEPLPFAEALLAEHSRLKGEVDKMRRDPTYRSTEHQWHSYRRRGCYMDQLEQWLRFFPREQLLVLLSEEFYAAPSATLRQVTDFLDVAPLPEAAAASFEKHNLARYDEMPAAEREKLAVFYRSHNARLAEFLGRSPGW